MPHLLSVMGLVDKSFEVKMQQQPNFQLVSHHFEQLQDEICNQFQRFETSARFQQEQWHYSYGGGGRSRVIEGDVFEKGGVNFSNIQGQALPASATQKRPHLAGKPFAATGVSIVMHPRNPYAPTSHLNVRYFEAGTGEDKQWWFGGGYDLTPYYGFEDDCIHWHSTIKQVCDAFDVNAYSQYKKWCDDYFYIRHRDEARGIGGLFFDDLNEPNFATVLNFVMNIGKSYCDAYLPIVERRYEMPYSERQKQFQQYRRGRYVEFNLVYDRGTLFGLQSGGRTESILMSMPPVVRWQYNYKPEEGTEEARLYSDFLPVKDWLIS